MTELGMWIFEIIDHWFVCGGSASLGMQGNQGLLLPTQENYQHTITASYLLVFVSLNRPLIITVSSAQKLWIVLR